MEFEIELGQEKFKIEITETKEGAKIKVNEKEFLFGEKDERKSYSFSQFFIPQKELFYQEKIVSPIPGEISEIFVKEKEEVKKGKILLTILAMKTENEILAPKDGVVEKILVKKGEKIQKAQELIIIK
jgi:biotin carboxyl carrier protein